MPNFNLPEELYYHPDSHLWARVEGELVRVGLDDVAQTSAQSISHIRLKPPGRPMPKDRPFGTMEAGKYVGPLGLPVAGKVVEINEAVMTNPKLANSDPYGAGWLVLVEPEDLARDLPALIHGQAVQEWLTKSVADWTARGFLKR
jgi:glycine cleavage system H protein